MKISQVLKDIRQQHQLTQEALAERLKPLPAGKAEKEYLILAT